MRSSGGNLHGCARVEEACILLATGDKVLEDRDSASMSGA
jgi:hypothetical protein